MSLWETTLAAVLAVLVYLLSRAGLVSRIEAVEEELRIMRERQKHIEMESAARVLQLSREFRGEVTAALAPIRARLEFQDQMLAQIRTMLIAVVNDRYGNGNEGTGSGAETGSSEGANRGPHEG